VNTNEIESTISTNEQMINESISSENLNKVVNEIVSFITEITNEGKETILWKQLTLDYFSNNNINLQEIHNWLLNNQIDSDSIFLLGYFNYFGIGINENHEKAFNLLISVSEQHMLAQFFLGRCYEEGYGIGKDIYKVIYWYVKSAEQGCPSAQHNLGVIYEVGEEIDKDMDKAIYWYKKSAEQGHRVAQNNLAIYMKMEMELIKIWIRQFIGIKNPDIKILILS
jgi:hypothetical protein